MAPGRPRKRASNQSTASAAVESPSTPQRSPIKKRKMGLNAQQKQVLIDNLQLEITERARRLRAQYNLQAQGLRSRVQIRINRIPTALRKVKMGDLLAKYLEQEQRKNAMAPPVVPPKDAPSRATHSRHQEALNPPRPVRAQKRQSEDFLRDKENEVEQGENPKKRIRGNPATESSVIRPGQVLSPTSSNSRLNRDRPASPVKSQIARPGSPLKSTGTGRTAAATSVLSSMVEKARATRQGATRKLTTTSNTSASSTGTTAATRTRRAAATTTAKPATSRPGTRMAHRVSENSEASENSTGTVVRKTAASKATAAPPKRTVMSTIKKGVTGGGAKKTTAAAKPAPAPAATTRSGRVLRGRG
ncbi:Borealin N terminal-domain-containing protein [Stachybotrys elegans]|uniref:Borealin N terminal-domain-containing protein n=1 Tax=Stachybotrys elegans TaxID=80388 RepID=A0A8K0T0E9_9HYPO|nr:Borealin N terminal-domain-containing protein [Stachybotrys elegans]